MCIERLRAVGEVSKCVLVIRRQYIKTLEMKPIRLLTWNKRKTNAVYILRKKKSMKCAATPQTAIDRINNTRMSYYSPQFMS